MGLFSAMEVSASGLEAQRLRVELLMQNIANSETTRTPEGGPYRRRDAIFTSAPMPTPFRAMLAANLGEPLEGVAVADITIDEAEPQRRYLPGHPDADQQGYVAFPHMNPVEDMIDLTGAARSYQANLAAMSTARDMLRRAMDLLR